MIFENRATHRAVTECVSITDRWRKTEESEQLSQVSSSSLASLLICLLKQTRSRAQSLSCCSSSESLVYQVTEVFIWLMMIHCCLIHHGTDLCSHVCVPTVLRDVLRAQHWDAQTGKTNLLGEFNEQFCLCYFNTWNLLFILFSVHTAHKSDYRE